MDFIEKMISELKDGATNQTENEFKGKNILGTENGEKREIVIHYTVGDEKNAKIVVGTDKIGHAEDALALMHVVGNVVGELLNCDGEIITSKIIDVVSKSMREHAMSMIRDMIKKIAGD